ncbi:MAG: CU044_5270 family protein [Actinomycetota bacterium]
MKALDLVRLVGTDVPEATQTARGRAEARLLEMIEAESNGGGKRSPERRGRTLARRALLPVAAVLVATLVVVVVLPRGGSPASAQQFLRDMGVVTGQQPSSALGSSEFVYTRQLEVFRQGTRAEGEQGTSELVEQTREQWISPNGAGRIVDVNGDEGYPRGYLTFLDPSQLPTDPVALAQTLREEESFGKVNTDAQLLKKVGSLLGGTLAPSGVREALYEVAAQVPGIQLIPDVIDPAGREGTAVVLDDGDVRVRLVIDPSNAQMLSRSESTRSPDSGDQVLDHEITYLAVGVVDSVDERPRGSAPSVSS